MDQLQFQKAEFAGGAPTCLACTSAIEKTYFHFNGGVICAACAEKATALRQRPDNKSVLRGLLYGLGAAALCSAGYAVFTMVTNMEAAIVAIAAGFVIGKAVRTGARGLGGRKLQVAAVALTYLAILAAHLPPAIQAVREHTKEAAAKKTARAAESSVDLASAPQASASGDANGGSKEARAVSLSPKRPRTMVGRVLGWMLAVVLVGVGVVALALVAPFTLLAGGVGGIISLVIIFFGLQQAWRQTRRPPGVITGPYELDGASNVVA
ncbi:MAG TPA: hypothetical protein VGR73_21025 [Bryobacteraceae bacterium]|nr:hypothetical protein [Bryobacteraceae bacterium]